MGAQYFFCMNSLWMVIGVQNPLSEMFNMNSW